MSSNGKLHDAEWRHLAFKKAFLTDQPAAREASLSRFASWRAPNEAEADYLAAVAAQAHPLRRRPPEERQSITVELRCGRQKLYLTVGHYDEACTEPCEIFVRMARPPKPDIRALAPRMKESPLTPEEARAIGDLEATLDAVWSMLRGMVDGFAMEVSRSLQNGVALIDIAEKHVGTNFEPRGMTGRTDIPSASSVFDLIFRWMWRRYDAESYAKRFGSHEPLPEGESAGDDVDDDGGTRS